MAATAAVETVDPVVLRSMKLWLAKHRVPQIEIDAVLHAVCSFYELKAEAHKGCKPQVAATAGGREAGRVHIRFHVTWPQLERGEDRHDRLMRVIGDQFTAQIGHLRQPHVKAHLLFVPATSYKRGHFEDFMREYARDESLTFLGAWPARRLVHEGAAA